MALFEYLTKNNIILGAKSRNRWDLINEMVDIAVKNGEIVPEDKESITKLLIEREKSMSTGIGNGVAIPHCTVSTINSITIVMVISKKGIDFDSIDNLPVKLVILLLVPKDKLSHHIKTLANIARIMSDKDLRNKLLTIKTPEGILKELKKQESTKKNK